MAPALILSSNNASNPLTLNLSNYLDLTDGSDMDPQDPAFSSKIISHSLLKEGGVLALEDWQNKELLFPLRINATSASALQQLIIQINQVCTSQGATYSWQDSGLSQPTIFDAISGEFDVKYRYRESEKFWASGDLKLFTQPFGHVASPRVYAAASGVGPLLMITPYASGTGAQVIGASTQAGVAGFGGIGQGGVPSSGIFYPGSPSLAGDAPALLQVSYVGPLPNTATNGAVVPYVAVSVLPDQWYQPIVSVPTPIWTSSASFYPAADAVYGRYFSSIIGDQAYQVPAVGSPGQSVPVNWAGQHRLFAIARASGGAGMLQLVPGALTNGGAQASVYPGGWGVYDLGTFALRASEAPAVPLTIRSISPGSVHLDVTAFVRLPDSSTWFLNPTQVIASQYGWPAAAPAGNQVAPFSNTLLLDDIVGDQFIYWGASQSSAPSPLGSVPSAAPVTAYSRGLVPRPDPKNGLPIIAVLGVGQQSWPGQFVGGEGGESFFTPSASWANPQNLRTMVQVDVLERTRYVLP